MWDKNEPVIPGSSLRGMLRAVVEIASFSKVSEFSNARLVYRAVGDSTNHGKRYRALLTKNNGESKAFGGYMRKRGSDWYIQRAQIIEGGAFSKIKFDPELFRQLKRCVDYQNASEIYIKVAWRENRVVITQRSPKPADGLLKAVLVRSGKMKEKLSEAVIFPPDEDADWLRLSDEKVDEYLAQISPEQKKILGHDKGVLKEGQPVFFTLERDAQGGLLRDKEGREVIDFFGHCRMLRLPYPKRPLEFVPEESYQLADIDLAEALFGFTKILSADDYAAKERHYAGRVRVSEARLCTKQIDIWLAGNGFIIPRVLASPKPTTFQHYLVQQQAHKLSDFAAPTPKETVIRGHKLYWHKGAIKLADIQSPVEIKDTQSTQIRPLRVGVAFEFRMRFDNLSSVELGALLWVLQLGAHEHYRLKVGMGKPLGMGAVKVMPQLQLIDRTARYSTLFNSDDWASGLHSAEIVQRTQTESVEAFERFVLTQVAPNQKELKDVSRIRQLLALLSWPGPDPARTRYLEIKHPETGRNEYARRPVLPSPLFLTGDTESIANQAPFGSSHTAPQTPLPKPPSMTTIAEGKKTSLLRREKHVETVLLCTPVSGKGNAAVRTESAQEVLCRRFPSWQTPKVNERVKAEVIYEGEKAIEATWKANL